MHVSHNPKNSLYSFGLHGLVRLLDRYADAYLAERFQLSYSRFVCMCTLRELGSATQHELAQHMTVGDAVVSRMLKPLAAAGYVLSQHDPNHGRKKVARLTEKGIKLVDDAASELEKQYRSLGDASSVDVEQLNMQVEKMKRQLIKKMHQRSC